MVASKSSETHGPARSYDKGSGRLTSSVGRKPKKGQQIGSDKGSGRSSARPRVGIVYLANSTTSCIVVCVWLATPPRVEVSCPRRGKASLTTMRVDREDRQGHHKADVAANNGRPLEPLKRKKCVRLRAGFGEVTGVHGAPVKGAEPPPAGIG
eukprot:4345272-Amphidinium_carterae.1